jgi:hypothetical protein
MSARIPETSLALCHRSCTPGHDGDRKSTQQHSTSEIAQTKSIFSGMIPTGFVCDRCVWKVRTLLRYRFFTTTAVLQAVACFLMALFLIQMADSHCDIRSPKT